MDFLILYKTGKAEAEAEVCAVIRGKSKDEGEEAIKEAMVNGPGQYVAIGFDPSNMITRQAEPSIKLTAAEA